MQKNSFKRYIICTLLISSMCFSIPVLSNTTSSVNDTIDTSYSSLTNIQKQLRVIVKNSYVNKLNDVSNSNNKKQLDIYSSQLTKIKSDLFTISITTNPEANKAKLQSLLTISSYLSYIVEKTNDYLSTADPSDQYETLDAISIANSLVRQISSYITP